MKQRAEETKHEIHVIEVEKNIEITRVYYPSSVLFDYVAYDSGKSAVLLYRMNLSSRSGLVSSLVCVICSGWVAIN